MMNRVKATGALFHGARKAHDHRGMVHHDGQQRRIA
jgi:hypothetical protein